MGNDPYSLGKLNGNSYALKSDVIGRLVVVLQGHMPDRGLQLITPVSRAMKRFEVHELIMTDEQAAAPGEKVNQIAYLGFFSVTQEGVIIAGDEVFVNDKLVGRLAGFDDTHMPNHQNIVIRCSGELLSGVEMAAQLGMTIKFKRSK